MHRLDTVVLLRICCMHFITLPTHSRWLKSCHKVELRMTLLSYLFSPYFFILFNSSYRLPIVSFLLFHFPPPSSLFFLFHFFCHVPSSYCSFSYFSFVLVFMIIIYSCAFSLLVLSLSVLVFLFVFVLMFISRLSVSSVIVSV